MLEGEDITPMSRVLVPTRRSGFVSTCSDRNGLVVQEKRLPYKSMEEGRTKQREHSCRRDEGKENCKASRGP